MVDLLASATTAPSTVTTETGAFGPPPTRDLRVWIVEDESSFREMLGDYLGTLPGIRLAGGSRDHADLMIAAAEGQVDLVVLDLMLQPVGGLAVMQELAVLSHPPAVLILTSNATEHAVLMAALLGARGFVEKNDPLQTMEVALQRIAAGGVYFSQGPRRMLGQSVIERWARIEVNEVSRREVTLLVALLNHQPITETASQLHLSVSSVYRLRSQLMQKAALRNNRELRWYATRMGLNGSKAGL